MLSYVSQLRCKQGVYNIAVCAGSLDRSERAIWAGEKRCFEPKPAGRLDRSALDHGSAVPTNSALFLPLNLVCMRLCGFIAATGMDQGKFPASNLFWLETNCQIQL